MMLAEIENLNFSYNLNGKHILKNLSLNVTEGQRILLAGINGAGKSTFLRILGGKHMAFDVSKFTVLGFRTPQDGIGGVAFVGDNWTQSVSFVGRVAYSIDLPVKHFMRAKQEENIERRNLLCNILKINLDWNMRFLSDGQRRRVQIMLGLIHPFKLLLLDEVTSELDIIVRTNLLNFLKKETEERNASIIYATHILDGLDNWITDIRYINCHGKIENLNDNLDTTPLKKIIISKMISDYNEMDMNNIVEKEGQKKEKCKSHGPQGGYSSGRSQNL